MSLPQTTRTTDAASAGSPDRAEIHRLLESLGTNGEVLSFTNPNNVCVIAGCTRENKAVRFFVEGASTLAHGERVVLAAIRAAVGGN